MGRKARTWSGNHPCVSPQPASHVAAASGFQPLSNHSFELIRYRFLNLKGGMRRTLPPHQQPTLITPEREPKRSPIFPEIQAWIVAHTQYKPFRQ